MAERRPEKDHLRVLQVHNFYRQPGGEDQVYAAECELLRRYGVEVEQYSVHNDALSDMAGWRAGLRTVWNGEAHAAIQARIRSWRPDVVHAHNTFPLVSPALYYAAHAEGVPVVQTLHNYRLICPSATMYRAGHACEDCIGESVPYSGVLHGCYRGSRPASATVSLMLTGHRAAGTYRTKVDRYIALTEFARNLFVRGGLPAGRITVKPNFLLDDPGAGTGSGGYGLFVGRLSEEKGLRTLLDAWSKGPGVPLQIAGDGPLREYVVARSQSLEQVKFLGRLDRTELWNCLKSARFLVVPSEWYEGLPMVVIEAFACGTPVIASDIGSLRELVSEGENGRRFVPGNSDDLVRTIRELSVCASTLNKMREAARQSFQIQYSAERNYQLLRGIYADAIASRASLTDAALA